GVLPVLRTGKTQLTPHITDELWAQTAVSEEHLALLRELNHRTMMRVPLRAANRVVGAISFFSEVPNRYGPAEVRLAEDLAGRASLAIENARLYREARRAQEDLRA